MDIFEPMLLQLKNNLCLGCIGFLFMTVHCTAPGAGFAGYQKPNRYKNPYYDAGFNFPKTGLACNRKYCNSAIIEEKHKNITQNGDYFVFYSNGFVLHNAHLAPDKNDLSLNYANVYSEEVGSYAIKGDSIFIATKAGYQKHYLKAAGILQKDTLQLAFLPAKAFTVSYVKM
jgi:hypothetical protein